MIQTFIEGLSDYHFLQNALITSVAIGIVAGAIGCFIILRGMSLMGDAIAHAVLPGVALSYILGINFFVGAIIFGIIASLLITYISNHSIVKSDTAIADADNAGKARQGQVHRVQTGHQSGLACGGFGHQQLHSS